MMRMPPDIVPSEMALAAAMMTHNGMSSPLCSPPAIRASTMTPMVFWASWRP